MGLTAINHPAAFLGWMTDCFAPLVETDYVLVPPSRFTITYGMSNIQENNAPCFNNVPKWRCYGEVMSFSGVGNVAVSRRESFTGTSDWRDLGRY